MNNKGFAISGMLYGILLLFLMILLSLLYVLVIRLERLTTINEEVSQNVENKNIKDINQTINTSNYYITSTRGKYEIKINSNTCYSYLPKNVILKIQNNKINYILSTEQIDLAPLNPLELINCTNNSITSADIVKVYTSEK